MTPPRSEDDRFASSFARSRARREAAQRQRARRRTTLAGLFGALLLAAALAGLSVALSGSPATKTAAQPRTPPAPRRAVHTPDDGSGTWLVAARGPQPTVAAENALPGTRAWRMPGPAAEVGGLAHGTVVGYASPTTPLPGSVERIYVSSPGTSWVRIRIFRIGWYGGTGGRQVYAGGRLRLGPQAPCTHFSETGLTTCHWRPTLTTRLPETLASGVYIVRLTTASGTRDCFFVVRATHPAPILAQLPTATYEAYNAWGGDSLYPGGADTVGVTGTTQGVEVSYDRPYSTQTGAGQFFTRDVAMVWFLERYRIPVSYTTSESVDGDPGQLAGHRALLDFGHSEYWSQPQVSGWEAALRRGTSLLFLSSDTLGWRVRDLRGAAAGGPDPVIVAYKEHAARDPDVVTPSGSFPDRGAALTGSAYLGCITPRLPVTGAPTYQYFAWRPAAGRQPRWLFAGTGITAATRIPGIVGYELDERTSASPRGTTLVGYGAAPCMSHRGGEPGEPIPAAGEGLAETTVDTAPSGATVFSTGTLGWELALEPVPSASPDAPRAPDPRVVAMTRNVLAHVLRASH